MNPFVDSSAWLALEDVRDQHHADARRGMDLLAADGLSLVTTDYVLVESFTLIRRWLGYAVSVAFGRSIRTSAVVQTVRLDESLWQAAWTLFETFPQSNLSFVDCTSAAVMRAQGMQRVFGFDHDFKVLGFELFPP